MLRAGWNDGFRVWGRGGRSAGDLAGGLVSLNPEVVRRLTYEACLVFDQEDEGSEDSEEE